MGSKIPDRVRKLIFERDGGRCVHCGETEAIGLQHRINRGMGGSKTLDLPANLITFCNVGNAAMESIPVLAEMARKNGWKLSRWDDPLTIPVLDRNGGERWILDNTYGRRRAI